MSNSNLLEISSRLTTKQRFEKFTEFFLPNGMGGLNEFVGDDYSEDAPYLALTKRFVSASSKNLKVYAIKCEYKLNIALIRQARVGANSSAWMEEPFRSFFKAWINLHLHYSGVRSAPRSIVTALRYIEKELRDLHGHNAPWNITSEVAYAAVAKVRINYSEQHYYDICQQIEILISMLNDGKTSGRSNYYRKGFNLFSEPFAFKNPVKLRRKNALMLNENLPNIPSLSNEDVYCIARAYIVAKSRYGSKHYLTYLAGLCALPTICSLRISEIFSLSVNSLFHDVKDDRWKLRVYRYKNDYLDDVPVPDILVDFAKDIFKSIQEYSESPRRSLKILCNKNFNICEMPIIKDNYNKLENIDYIPCEDIKSILGMESVSYSEFIRVFSSDSLIDPMYGIKEPNDIDGGILCRYYHIGDVIDALKIHNIEFNKKYDISFSDKSTCQYISISSILSYAKIGKTKLKTILYGIDNFIPRAFFSKIKFFAYLESSARQHINEQCIFYPYTDKNKYLLMEDALCLSYFNSTSERLYTRRNIPELTTAQLLNRFISSGGSGRSNANRRSLFKELDIKKRDGSYPDFTVHDLRKFHQTAALLRGASVFMCDRLAGRQTGYQSDHYDLRTVDQRLEQSIEFFDPTADYEVIGSDAEFIPKDPVNRKKFLQDNVSPKHTHEYGGCISDWSLNPCENYGGCMTCGCHEWMKGDELKFEFIIDLFESKIKELARADQLIEMGNDSVPIFKHRQQIVDILKRCNEIFEIESDDNIKVGTLVLFSKAEAAFTTADHVNFLRSYAARGDDLNAL